MEETAKSKIENEVSYNSSNPFLERNARPQFLTVLCILSFIGSGLGILSSFGFILAYDWIMALIEDNPMASQMDFTQTDFIISLILSIVSLLGAILMFRMKRLGFFVYVGANIIAAFLPDYSTFTLIFNAIWIGMYAANFKYLK